MMTGCIISCTAHKRSKMMPAENLYSSELFYRSRRYAQANFDFWLILSAKHGLISPGTVIAPYDVSLTSLTGNERVALAHKVAKQASKLIPKGAVQVTSICGNEYDALLTDAGVQFKRSAEFALPIGKKLEALGLATDPNRTQPLIEQVYQQVGKLASVNDLLTLRESFERGMPDSGVYLFFDKQETRLKNLSERRIVRIGTHGVAVGSKASLRNRMRTHFGTTAGKGNHRSSIFRLHVGRSMINARLADDVKTWGSPKIDKRTLLKERILEQDVSRYLSALSVAMLWIPGESSKNNDRAYIEQNLIALISNGCRPLDPPSSKWLGLNSSKSEIRKSGLWNVNHVDQNVDSRFLDVLKFYVSFTIGEEKAPVAQLAPQDWLVNTRGVTSQLTLL